ncbi:hypothetical protein M0R19_05010 [Candidatus Pacearchaeota archaeon]|nr:hypothetical protein [Candidatus Pacearchaeota archaeon]
MFWKNYSNTFRSTRQAEIEDLKKRIKKLEEEDKTPSGFVIANNKFVKEQIESAIRRYNSGQGDIIIYNNAEQGRVIVASKTDNDSIYIVIYDTWEKESKFLEVCIDASDKCRVGRRLRETFGF